MRRCYTNSFGNCDVNDFFDDNIIGKLVGFESEDGEYREYMVEDVFERNGQTFVELILEYDPNAKPVFLSDQFFLFEDFDAYDDEDVELERFFPTDVFDPYSYEAHIDYLIDMQRDRELFGW